MRESQPRDLTFILSCPVEPSGDGRQVSVDVRSSQAGLVKEIMGEPGDTVAVGALLAKIDTSAPKPAGEE